MRVLRSSFNTYSKNSELNLWVTKGKTWAGRIGFSLLDQAIFSGSNFLLNILLVRWLPIDQYGTFSVIYTIFLIASTFYNALILEPMSVIGASQFDSQIPRYLRSVFFLQSILTISFSIFFILSAVVSISLKPELTQSLIALAVGTPLMLLFWLYRQKCYLQTKPAQSFIGSLLYACILLTSLVGLHSKQFINPYTTLMIMGLASLITVIVLWHDLLKTIGKISFNSVSSAIKEIWSPQWNYGKWVTGTAFVYSFSTLVYPLLIGFILGMTEAGIFRATQNLTLPLQQSLSAMSILFIPILSRLHSNSGIRSFQRGSVIVIVLFSLGGFIYNLFLLLFGSQIVRILYPANLTDISSWLIPFWVGIGMFTSINSAVGIILRGLQKPNVYFYAYSISAAFTLSLGVYATFHWALTGVMVSMLVSQVLIFIVFLVYFFIRIKRN